MQYCSLAERHYQLIVSVQGKYTWIVLVCENFHLNKRPWDVTKTGNGEWGMGNGKWEMGNGKWEMGN